MPSSRRTARSQRFRRSRTMPGRITRALRRLPVAPIAWSIAVRVWWATRVRPRPLPSVLRRLASGSVVLNRPVTDAVAVVQRLVPRTGRGRCLPRSLILYGLLHRIGHSNCSFCLGVQPETFRQKALPDDLLTPEPESERSTVSVFPSEHPPGSGLGTEAWAHAWVEVEGEPLAEPTDPRRTHRVLYRHPTRTTSASVRAPQ